jgi:hypothetical protein
MITMMTLKQMFLIIKSTMGRNSRTGLDLEVGIPLAEGDTIADLSGCTN